MSITAISIMIHILIRMMMMMSILLHIIIITTIIIIITIITIIVIVIISRGCRQPAGGGPGRASPRDTRAARGLNNRERSCTHGVNQNGVHVLITTHIIHQTYTNPYHIPKIRTRLAFARYVHGSL